MRAEAIREQRAARAACALLGAAFDRWFASTMEDKQEQTNGGALAALP
jgi:hypothetical protein